jgi:ribulose-phosphate 3-epimerase
VRPDPGWLDALPRRLLAELSLWSADLGRMAEAVARTEPWADAYHLDVADGHFSPDLLLFPDLVAAVRRLTARPLHVHLMVADSILEAQIRQFVRAGADLVSVHAEHAGVDRALSLLAELGVPAGLVLQLGTPVAAALPHLERIRCLTLLGTRIGVKGQGLDPAAEGRLREAAALLAGRPGGRRVLLAADGAIREHTVPGLRRAGADAVVMGSLAFEAPDLPGRMAWIQAQGREPGPDGR